MLTVVTGQLIGQYEKSLDCAAASLSMKNKCFLANATHC